MLLNEVDAKSTWCPMVRVGEGSGTDNRSCLGGKIIEGHPGAGADWDCCIASDCMLWVWHRTPVMHTEFGPKGGDKTGVGYCGLMRNL
jgi:hypothetical protein